MKIKVTKVLQFDRTDVTKYESKVVIWWKKMIGDYIEPIKIYRYQARCEARLIDDFHPTVSMMVLKASHYWKVDNVDPVRIYTFLTYNSTAFSPDELLRENLLGEAIAICR